MEILSTKHMKLSINRVIMSHTRVCLFTQSCSVKRLCYYVKKLWSIHHAIMLNSFVVLS